MEAVERGEGVESGIGENVVTELILRCERAIARRKISRGLQKHDQLEAR